MGWWCFDREKFVKALDEYVAEAVPQNDSTGEMERRQMAANIEHFLYSDAMKRHDNCRNDDGQRDFQ